MTYIKLQDTTEYQEILQAVSDSGASAAAANTSAVNAYNSEVAAYNYMLATMNAVNDNREVPSGVVNGINKIFTATYAFVAGTVRLYLNGIREFNFTETSDTQIELSDAPLNTGFTDRVEITYKKK